MRAAVVATLASSQYCRGSFYAIGDNLYRVCGPLGLQHLVGIVGFAQMIVGLSAEKPACNEEILSCLIQSLAVEVVRI